jgi:hypothetical protein
MTLVIDNLEVPMKKNICRHSTIGAFILMTIVIGNLEVPMIHI